jgi:hypothetical protein
MATLCCYLITIDTPPCHALVEQSRFLLLLQVLCHCVWYCVRGWMLSSLDMHGVHPSFAGGRRDHHHAQT